MIGCAQDVIVPDSKVIFLFVEELEFVDEEEIEVSVHENRRWLLEGGKPRPVEGGSEGAVAVGIAEVR